MTGAQFFSWAAAISVAAGILLTSSPAWAPLIDDPKPAKLPCKYQFPPSKVDCPKEYDEFRRRMERNLSKKRDRVRELEDRVQELERRIEGGR